MPPHNPALRGILLMVVSLGVFTLTDAIGKYLLRFYPVPGVVWARYGINVLPLFAFLAWRGELRYLRTARPRIQLARGLLLGMALMNALYHILTCKAAGVEPPLTSLFYGSFVGAVMFLPVLPFAWQTPRASTSPAGRDWR